jgi:hypothetical protein
MKIMIEVAGGMVTNITATQEVSIYLIDHDSLKEREDDEILEGTKQAMQPDYITWEEGIDEAPEFMVHLNEALEEYEEPEWEDVIDDIT